jgi:hypothetical protein
MAEQGDSLITLLVAVEEWAAGRGDDATSDNWTISRLNLEFLANVLDEQRSMAGKAKYRATVVFHVDDQPRDDEALRLSLQRGLHSSMGAFIRGEENFVVVSDLDPRSPHVRTDATREFSLT